MASPSVFRFARGGILAQFARRCVNCFTFSCGRPCTLHKSLRVVIRAGEGYVPWPDFSEVSFGFSFLRDFERLHAPGGAFPSAPDFISQADVASLGYDVEAALAGSNPVF